VSFLPPADREYLIAKGIAFAEAVDGARKGLILRQRPLPSGRFDAPAADILIVLPPGYPDVAPDMFHLLPWVRLTHSHNYPRRADSPVRFLGQEWQRWSRHNSEWRPGTDGIWTMIKRVETALAEAA
jgi:Prokaryotic E2 family E